MVLPPRGHSYYNGRESEAARAPVPSVPAELDWGSPIARDSLSPEIDLGDFSHGLSTFPTTNPVLRRTTRELPRISSITDAPVLTRMPGVVLSAQSASDLSRRSRSRSRGRSPSRSRSRSRSRSSGRTRRRLGGRRSRRN